MSYQQILLLIYVPVVLLLGLWLGSSLINRMNRTRGYLITLTATAVFGLAGWLLYREVGAADDLATKDAITKAFESGDQADLEHALESVKSRIDDQNDNAQYFALAGMLESQLGRSQSAEQYYKQLVSLAPNSADAHAEYAQHRFVANERQIDDAVVEAVSKALALDENNITALGIKGIMAFEMGAYEAAAKAWGRGMQLTGESSPSYNFLAQGAFQAMQRAQADKNTESKSGLEAARRFEQLFENPNLLTGTTLKAFLASDNARVLARNSQVDDSSDNQLNLSLSWATSDPNEFSDTRLDALSRTNPDGVLLVYTRAQAGPKMPLAIKRVNLQELPLTLTLSKPDSMLESMTINSMSQQELIVRYAPSGKINLKADPSTAKGAILHAEQIDFSQNSSLTIQVRIALPE